MDAININTPTVTMVCTNAEPPSRNAGTAARPESMCA